MIGFRELLEFKEFLEKQADKENRTLSNFIENAILTQDINADTVQPAGTYTINDSITISDGASLTIEDGATVIFATDGYLWVQNGAIVATSVTFSLADQWNSADIPEIMADSDPLPSGDNNDVDAKDLIAFIAELSSAGYTNCHFALDADGDVDRADLFLFAEDFGRINSTSRNHDNILK